MYAKDKRQTHFVLELERRPRPERDGWKRASVPQTHRPAGQRAQHSTEARHEIREVEKEMDCERIHRTFYANARSIHFTRVFFLIMQENQVFRSNVRFLLT